MKLDWVRTAVEKAYGPFIFQQFKTSRGHTSLSTTRHSKPFKMISTRGIHHCLVEFSTFYEQVLFIMLSKVTFSLAAQYQVDKGTILLKGTDPKKKKERKKSEKDWQKWL